MNELVVIDPEGNVRRYPLNFDELGIGRDPQNQILLDDARVSRRHARVYRGEKGHYIEDLGSANGVLLDGAMIRSPALISVGAKVEIGGFVFTVVPEGTNHPSLDHKVAKLKAISGPLSGQEFAMTTTRVSVGRVEGNQIVVDEPSVSRHHARIQREGIKYVLYDLGSSNGTFVGGRPVTQRELNNGDKVSFGSVHFRFLLPGGRGGVASLPPLVIYAIAFGILLIATGIALALVLRPKAVPAISEQSAGAAQREIAEGLSLGHAAMQREDWENAVKQFDRVLARDLTNGEAKAQKIVAQDNNIHRQLLLTGENALAKNDKVQAIAALSRIPATSIYAERAQKLTNRLSEAQRNEAHGPRDFRFTAEEEKLLKQRYLNPKTAEAINLYLKGDFDGATLALSRLQKGKNSEANAASISKDIHAVRAKQADGALASQAGDYDKALVAWDEALKTDLQIVPEQVRSQPRNDLHRMMGDSLYRAGHTQYLRGNYAEAFGFWKRGSERSPENVDVLQGLGRLEAFAESIYAEIEKQFENDPPRACTRLNEVIALTRDTAPVNAKARAEQQARCRQ